MIKGKLETTFEWRCECGWENKRLDDQHCAACGKLLTTERCKRHFKLTPEPVKTSHLMKI